MSFENSIEQVNVIDAEQHLTSPSRVRLAVEDIWQGLSSWRIWLMLSWQDIRLRYRRSSLGPFWITISMAITIYTMGFLYGHLFKQDLKIYYPFLAAGMLTWNLIYLLITEGTNTFIEAENYLKQMKLPYTIFILRIVCRVFIIFLHNIVVIIPIIIFLNINISLTMLMLIPGVIIIMLNGFFYGSLLAMIGARYRDVSQIIISLMQVAFFLTPIMWNPIGLSAKFQFVTLINPFAQYVELLRAPLMGSMPSLYAYVMTIFLTFIGAVVTFYIFAKVRHRIIYWL